MPSYNLHWQKAGVERAKSVENVCAEAGHIIFRNKFGSARTVLGPVGEVAGAKKRASLNRENERKKEMVANHHSNFQK